VVESVRSFAFNWHATAEACGWPLVSLYGLHPTAPLARRDAMGAGFVIALSPHRVVGLTKVAIVVETGTGAHLRIHRPPVRFRRASRSI
jgi:hypothetical protein